MELTRARGNVWSARTEGIGVTVAGTEHGPDPELERAARSLVSRWSEIRAAIERFAASLPPDTSIPLQPPSNGSFAAKSCRFDEPLNYMSIEVTQRDAPSRATVTFYTGYPDGYASFEIMLEDGRPIAIEAYAS